MSSGNRHKGVSLGDHEVDEALANPAVRRRLARLLRVDQSWDIPYLGGYSEDGRTIFLDRHLPKRFRYRGREVDLDRFLIVHEEIEKALIDELDFKYAHAHEVATRGEENAVRLAGIDVPWYRRVLRPFIKADEAERLLRVPRAMDLTPYRAPPVDEGLLGRIRKAQDSPSAPGKLSYAQAGYHAGSGPHGRHCGICAYFAPEHRCAVVAGKVNAEDGCDYFVKAYQPEEHAHGQ
jgi:hypothetical protein